MPDHAERPLLFLDVDGTLLPYGGARLPSTPQGWEEWQDVSNPQLAKIDLGHGPRLLALPCVLMWATAWMESANEVIAPLLGLPELPVSDLPDAPGHALLHRVDSTIGLTDTDFAVIDDWLRDRRTQAQQREQGQG